MQRRVNAVFCHYFLRSSHLKALSLYSRAVHKHIVRYELPIVLVRCHHVRCIAFASCHTGNGANHIVCLIVFHFNSRDIVSTDYVLNIWNRESYILRLCIASSLVLRVSLVAECFSVRGVKTHSNVRGILFTQNLVKCIAKTENSRSVKPF